MSKAIERTEETVARAQSLIAECDEEIAMLQAREDYLIEQLDRTRDSIARQERRRRPLVEWLGQPQCGDLIRGDHVVCAACGGGSHAYREGQEVTDAD